MSTKPNPETTESIVEVHDEKVDDQDAANAAASANKGSDNPPAKKQSLCVRCANEFNQCLHHQPKSMPKEEERGRMSKHEIAAYKTLMDDLAGEPEEHPWSSVKEFTIWVLVLAVFIALLTTTASLHEFHKESVLNLRVHRWVALFMVLILGLPCIRFVTLVISEPLAWISWYVHARRYGFFYIRQMKRSFDVTLWFGLLFWVWYAWYGTEITYDTKGAKPLHIPLEDYRHLLKEVAKEITRLLLALTIAGILWTLKTAFFSYLKASLHYKYLCPKIQRAILDLYGIQFINAQEQGKWSFLIKHKNGNGHSAKRNENDNKKMTFWVAISHLNKDTAPVWILKRLTFMYKENMRTRRPKVLSDLKTEGDDEKFMEEANRMYLRVVGETRSGERKKDHITVEDLGKYQLKQKDLDCVFRLFTNKDGETTIAEDQFLRWAVTALKNCQGMESTIISSERIFKKLNILLGLAVVVLALVIWLLLSELVTTAQLAILFTPFVSASFVFGESLKRTFNGLMFVFGMHPFDVSDRVEVGGIKMKVKEMKLLTTIFFKYDTGDEVTYPNSELATKSIVNLDINKNMSDFVEFNIPIDTPEDLMTDLKIKIKKSLDDEITFTSNAIVAEKEINDDKIVTMAVCFEYLVAYHSSGIKTLHRSRIVRMIMRRRKELQQATKLEKDFEAEKNNFESDIVKFWVDSKLKLGEIEELNKNIIDILQKHESSFRDFSKVVFTEIDKHKIISEVHMRNKLPSKLGVNKQTIKQEIEKVIKKKGRGSLVCPEQHVIPEGISRHRSHDHCAIFSTGVFCKRSKNN